MVTKQVTKKRKIAVVTGTRAEYGLLYFLMREIQQDPALELQVIATGMHLSPEFGLTYQLVEQDGFNLAAKVEMLLSSDTAVGIAKSVGLAVIGFAEVFAQLKPDIIVLLGDRFEALAVAQTALICKIPVAQVLFQIFVAEIGKIKCQKPAILLFNNAGTTVFFVQENKSTFDFLTEETGEPNGVF